MVDHYHTGIQILESLAALIPHPGPKSPYSERQRHKRTLRAATLRLLAPIKRHRLALDHGQEIGFLKELYPQQPNFYLPFAQVQELHGAWNSFSEGVHLAVLGHRIHPFFGTYVPTRTSHLELFGTWLSQYTGDRKQAVDVGTGCGVLAFMLSKSGFEHVHATDINPNAIESVSRDLKRRSEPPAISLHCGDLLDAAPRESNLIVFNPPWMQGEQDGLLDQALFYSEGLFERFFDQARNHLHPEGRIVLVFSNVIRLVQPDIPHPIEAELERGHLRLVQKMQRKVKPTPGPDGRKRKTREKVEIWELSHSMKNG